MGNSCKAFDRIPYEIWYGKLKHDVSYPGDHGYLYVKGADPATLSPERIKWLWAEAEEFGRKDG